MEEKPIEAASSLEIPTTAPSSTPVPIEPAPSSSIVSSSPSAPPTSAPKKTKSTLNLQQLLNNAGAPKESKTKPEEFEKMESRSLSIEEVKEAWSQFAEKRKNQVAEYGMLQREIELKGNLIQIHLGNPVEEQILAALKTELLVFLRTKLNSDVSIESVLQKTTSKKIIYTNKEKFDHLAEKYPALHELKDRLGLDTDY